MKLEMNSKLFFKLALGVIGLIVIGLGFAYRAGLGMLSDGKQQVGQLQAKLEATEEKLAMAQTIDVQLSQLEFIKDVALEVLPDSKAQPELVGQILLIASRNNVAVSSIQFSGQTGNNTADGPDISQAIPLPGVPGVYTLPLTIQVNGNYDNILSMLQLIEQNRRKIQTKSVTIRPVFDGDVPTSRVSSDITLDVYIMP